MRSYAFYFWLVAVAAVAIALSLPEAVFAQSLTTGGVVGTVTDPSGAAVPNATQFGSSLRTVATPTSIFGSFLGADASPRALQIRAQLTF